MAYEYTEYPYKPPQSHTKPKERHPVVIVGAGPVGLSMAIDLALHGIKSIVLDENNVVSVGSRAICWAKRTLEIFDRLGVGERLLAKGITWKIGRQFHREREIYSFNLLPEDGHKYPAFINIQQYYVEEYLIHRAMEFPALVDLRFKHRVIDHHQENNCVQLTVHTPDGEYALEADWYIACDGARSTTRERMGLTFEGQSFEEQFLIADIEMEEGPFDKRADPERWFWFDPPFHTGKSALLHMQPDNIYRIDLQLDVDADISIEAERDTIETRVRAIVENKPFRLDWASIYKFQCAKLDRFVHGRIIFAGDSAHVVSPFGARGGNGGIQDIDNLGWKLSAVIKGEAPAHLIESYNEERSYGSAENILNSSRATNFMTPKSPIEALFRTETLRLARNHLFAQKLINSGRLSVPCSLAGFDLQTPGISAHIPIGSSAIDAPLTKDGAKSWMIEHVQDQFTLVGFGDIALPRINGIQRIGIDQATVDYPCYSARQSMATQRYGTKIAYLFRPDGHICATFTDPDSAKIEAALKRAKGLSR